jgi:glycosyltransferase involved in cell wall biosynthesis
VRFSGLQERSEFFEGIDIFVLASRWEGMPNVVLEAMACEKPVVSTDVGGVADILEDRNQGLLVPAGDPQFLGAAMLTLAQDPDLRKKCAGAACKKVTEEFGLNRMVAAYASLYESLLRRN